MNWMHTMAQWPLWVVVVGDINQLSANRRLRLLYSRAEINGILWLVLLVGAIPAIGYTLLFANRHRWVQVLITMKNANSATVMTPVQS